MMKKRRKYNFLFLVSMIAVSVTAAIGFSYAAYIYNNMYENQVDFNTGSFSEHFAGGTGTSASPYLIANPDHLRNLQKLNVFGVFSKNTYFRLNDSFTWSGDPLHPIGTEDNPFYSQFEGYGKTITNLEVVGSHTSDVGMFGYTAIGSNLQNFILSAPLIKVNTTDNPSKLSTTNPLAAYLQTDAESLAITLDNSTKKFFTVNKQSIMKDGQTFTIKFTSSDTSLLEWSAAQNRFNVKVPPNAETNKLYAVQLSAQVFAEYNGKIISHTLERWQINVKHDGTVSVASGDVKIGYWKTIYAAANEGAGPHPTYVGFFAGHLDGKASYLGLYGGTAKGNTNGRLEIAGRPARSYSVLIGRTFDDNLNDDANGVLRNKQINLTDANKVDKTFNVVADTNFSQTAFYTNTTNNAVGTGSASEYIGIDTAEQEFMRVYPGNPATKYVQTHTYQEINEDTYETKTSNVLQLSGGLKTYGYFHQAFWGASNGLQASQDAFWFYLSTNAVGSNFFTNTKDYEVTMSVKYTASGSTANNFQILYNFWDPAASGLLAARLESAEWTALSANASANYNPANYPVVQSYNNFNGAVTNPLFEHDITFTMTKTGISFISARRFMFSLGVGSGTKQVTNGSNNNYKKTYYNITDPSTFKLNIVSIDVTFSSLDGNVNRQVFNVDYINNAPTYNTSTEKWTSWNGFANVRANFNVTNTILTLNGGAGVANYRFWRQAGSGTPRVNYSQTTTDTAWKIANTDGYRAGTEVTGGY